MAFSQIKKKNKTMTILVMPLLKVVEVEDNLVALVVADFSDIFEDFFGDFGGGGRRSERQKKCQQ